MPVRHLSGTHLFMASCLSAALSIPSICWAAEWTIEPSVLLSLVYNDNLTLTTQTHNSVTGNIITPKLDLGVLTQAWKITGSAEASRIRYSGGSDQDRDDYAFRLSSAYQSERNIWQLDADSTRDSPSAGELTRTDLGALQAMKVRESHAFSPSWTRNMTERTKLQLMYQLNDTSYVNGESVGLYDYRYRTATAVVSSQLSEQTQVFATGSYSSFHTPATGYDSITRSFQVGVSKQLSESMKGTLQAGPRRTETITQGGYPIYTRFSTIFGDYLIQTGVTSDVRSQQTGSVFSGSLERQNELTRINTSLSRSIVPGGSGSEVEQDSFDFRLNRTITPRMSAFINLNTTKIRDDQGNILNNGYIYSHAEPGVNWAWSQELSLTTSYGYSRLKRDYENRAATSNSVYFALVYRPLKTSFSR